MTAFTTGSLLSSPGAKSNGSRPPLPVQPPCLSNSSNAVSHFEAGHFRKQSTRQELLLSAASSSSSSLPHRTEARDEQCGYGRRQLSIEAVQCIYLDESGGSGGVFTFLVKPILLQTGRSNSTNASRSGKAGNGKGRAGEQGARDARDKGQENGDEERQQELDPYHVQRSTREVLELANRLLSSFETLLDPKRGGPQPLTKELLSSKWTVRDIFKKKKKQEPGSQMPVLDRAVRSKLMLVNGFFQRVLRTGGEVLASSRAMQDFFDKRNTVSMATDSSSSHDNDNRVRPNQRQPLRRNESRSLIDEIMSDTTATEPTEELTFLPSWQSTPLSTPNSATPSATPSERRFKPWKRDRLEDQMTTPTTKVGAPGLFHSNSMTVDSSKQRGEATRGGGLLGTASTAAQQHCHTMFRSISQQDLRSDLVSWRREVGRADDERERFSIEPSGAAAMADRPSPPQSSSAISPHKMTPPEKATVCQVSGTAIKTKAGGWKIMKVDCIPLDQLERETPSIRSGSSKVAAEREEEHRAPRSSDNFSALAASRKREVERGLDRSGGKTSQSSTSASQCSEGKPSYIPSDLERLIFGNGMHGSNSGKSNCGSKLAKSGRQMRDECCDVESSQEEGGQRGRERQPLKGTGGAEKARREVKASYKVKGRASMLRLNLSGQSNIESKNMLATSPAPSPSSAPLCAVTADGRIEVPRVGPSSESSTWSKLRAVGSQESWIDPAMSFPSSPKQPANQSSFSLSIRSQIEPSPLQTAATLDCQLDEKRGSVHKEMMPDQNDQESMDQEAEAIEREVQRWRSRQNRKRLNNRF